MQQLFPMANERKRVVYGTFSRKLWSTYQKYMKGDCIPFNSIRDAFNELNLYPSLTQVHEMVWSTKECPAHNSGEGLGFGEFCVFVNELEEYYKKGQDSLKAVKEIQKCQKAEKTKYKDQVFLGGSCNPTTWRSDCAVPYLEKQGISYFNPQVEKWDVHQIGKEHEAKMASEVLLFVIDNRTRASSSLIEIAYSVGSQRQVLLVIHDNESKIPKSELEELKTSYDLITDISERSGYPVFRDLNTSLKCLNRMLKQHIKVQQLSSNDGARPVKHGHLRLGHSLQYLWEVFVQYSEGADKLSYKQACDAFHYTTGQLLDTGWMQPLVNGSEAMSFSTFCCLVMEAKSQLALCYPSLRQLLTNTLFILLSITKTVPNWLGWMFGRNSALKSKQVEKKYDFYLGGSYKSQNWREDIVLPILREHNCSSTFSQNGVWSWETSSLNNALHDECQLLLYVITSDVCALTYMIQAAYYIGQGYRVVLCLQMIPEETSTLFQGEKIDEQALQDYNRGRSYLRDIAERENVAVFSDIKEAVLHAVQIIKPSPPTLVMTEKVTI
ncbi:uncharacterized protein LOC115214842 isoform X1 [Octopus sinensis]|nr:uncharacterized protein LOC115214842 isoform X1 [Octopus sinensis]